MEKTYDECGYVIGLTPVTLPESFNDLHIKFTFSDIYVYEYYVPKNALTETQEFRFAGFGTSFPSDNYVQFAIDKHSMKVIEAYYASENLSSTIKLEVFYR